MNTSHLPVLGSISTSHSRGRSAVALMAGLALVASVALASCTPAPGTFLYFNMCGNPQNGCYRSTSTTQVINQIKARGPVAIAINEICLDEFYRVKGGTSYNGQFQGSGVNCASGLGEFGIAVFYQGSAKSVAKAHYDSSVQRPGTSERRSYVCVELHRAADFEFCTTHLDQKAYASYRNGQANIMHFIEGVSKVPVLMMGDLNMNFGDYQAYGLPAGFNYGGDNNYLIASWSKNWTGSLTSISTAGWTDHPGLLFTS